MTKDHFPTLAALIALAMLLATVVVLACSGQKLSDLSVLGISVAIGTLSGGFSPSFARAPSQISNSPGAQVTTTEPAKDK